MAGAVHDRGMLRAAPVTHAPDAVAPDTGRLHLLDGLRGLAAFAVILDHVPSATLASLTPGRYLAVDFFFVLSGYVLARANDERLRGGGEGWAFMHTRLARLYPLYLLGALIAIMTLAAQLAAGWSDISWSQLAIVAGAALLFLPMPPVFGWTTQHLYPLNGPAWSLFFELVANLVYARLARFLTLRVFAVLLPAAAVAVTVSVLNHEAPGPGWLWPHFDAGLSRVIFGFFAGVCLHRLRGRLPDLAVPAWLPALAFTAMIMVPAPETFRKSFDVASALLFAPLIVWLGANARVSGITADFCARLGSLSYGVYVLHVPVMGALGVTMAVAGWSPPYGFVHVILVAGLAAIAAALAGRLWDAPLRARLSRLARSPRPGRAQKLRG
jgi:peptidoglycan/LPS O-acetylase OafA/YrhL